MPDRPRSFLPCAVPRKRATVFLSFSDAVSRNFTSNSFTRKLCGSVGGFMFERSARTRRIEIVVVPTEFVAKARQTHKITKRSDRVRRRKALFMRTPY